MTEYLSNYSVVAIYYTKEEERHFFTSKSLIKNNIFLSQEAAFKDFENSLFFIEIDGNKLEFNVPIQYDQPVAFRHKISQKYLALSVDEEEEKEIRYKLVLGNEKKHFKIKACYQYQTKISTRIKFNEQIYLSTEYTESRHGLITTELDNGIKQLYLGFNVGSKFQFHFYTNHEKEEKYYKHGKIVWISHIESDNFLSLQNINSKQEIVFEPIKYDKQIQNLSALWSIESNNLTESKYLKYDEQIRFKNLFSGNYLSFSKNYKLVDNERIYQIYLEEGAGDYSRFVFKSIHQRESKQFEKNAYLSLQHYESNLFVGCRKEKVNLSCFKLLTFPYMEDEDLFKINEFTQEEEQALRFIFAIRKQFKEIAIIIRLPIRDITIKQMHQIEETYANIKRQFDSLKKFEKLFDFVRNQLGRSIQFIAENLIFFRNLSQAPQSTPTSRSSRLHVVSNKILALSYQIVCIFCINHAANQSISFKYMINYLNDIGMAVGAEEVFMQTLRNNNDLLPKINKPLGKEGNIVRMILMEFRKKNKERDYLYWKNLMKILQIINIMLFYNGNTLDMNQYVISEELFKNGLYELIFLPIHVQGERIMLFDSESDKFLPIEQVNRTQLNEVVDAIFQMFSNLTNNHSFNSKQYIHNYFAARNHACLTVFITYLNKPIRKQLYNKIINFLAKTYLDSSPRLKRHKPLSFVFFNFQDEKSNIEQEEAYYSSRLRQMLMLKAEESNVCKPLHYSNLLKLTDSAEPSMSEEQLVTFRLNLTEKILNSSDCSSEQLETVSLLMKLQCYTVNQMLQIYEQLKMKLIVGDISAKLVPKILEIIQQMFMLMQELELKKMRIYLQHKFLNKKDQQELKQDEYKYILPLSTRIFVPFNPKDKNDQLNKNEAEYLDLTGRNQTALHKEVKDYNQLRDTLALMHASSQMKKSLMQHFCNYKQNELNQAEASNYLSSIFNLILQSNLPKYKFLKLLSKSTILTHDEIGEFDHLFDVSKKLQYLISISEFWMVGDSEPDNVRLFLKYLNEIINYMFDNFQVGGEHNFERNIEELNIKKQLLIGSLGVHNLVFELLQKNFYLLQSAQSRKQLKKKYKQIFEACFTFLYFLIRHCGENKRIIYEYFSIMLMYQPTIQLGQIRIYIEFYRDQKDFVKEINFNFIENVIYKIIKRANVGRNDNCEFNPEYIDFIIVLIESLDIEGKFFIERLYNFLIKEYVLEQMLFLDDGAKKKKENKLCLLMRKMKIEPIQIPIIYHTKLLKLFNFILSSSSETIRNSFRIKLGQIFKVNYLIQILNEPDIYTHFGIEPKLKFILKKEVIILLLTLLDKSEFHTQIYESEQIMKLLQCYSRTLMSKVDKKEMSSESESLYLPYIEEYNEYMETYLNNKNLFYQDQVKPLLNKLTVIFDKQPRAQDTTIKDYLESLQEQLKTQMRMEITKRTTTFTHAYGLKDMKLKWRNFVDDDEDNSKEEKYAKKTILDILKSKKAQKIIEEELNNFYDLVKKNSNLFINSMIKLLTILFNTKNIDDGRKKESKTIEKTLKYLSGYLTYIKDEKQIKLIIQILQTNKFIEIFIQLTTRKQFQLTKMHLKNIFYYCLKILNFLLDKDTSDFKFNKLLYKIFKQNNQSYKFLEYLKQGAIQILSTIDSNNYYEQINSSLEQMYLCVDDVPLRLYEETYRMLTFLCKYQPFTDYLRSQQSFNEIDFLDKIYNILTFLYSDQKGINKAIKVSSVNATEYILDFVSSILTGGNKSNQNYIVDSKYGRFINSVLKIQSLEPVNAQRNVREELLDKIIQFYKSNGIEISDLLHSKINLIDFKHTYLLNRFKYILVKTLLQCLIANPNNITKIKLQIPLQIIKVNLIWIYEFYKQNKYEYEEKFILRERQNWMNLIGHEKDIETLYLRLGFFYYQLIQLYQEADDASGHADSIENDEKIINEEKEKERVVKKFFRTIQQKQRKEDMASSLTEQKLEDQMKQCYHIYYNALLFFEKNTGKIEVNLKDQILTVYFPILPLAQRITSEMEQEFKQGANRLSRDQKIKSLLQYENTFYEDLKGEDDYFNEVEQKMPYLGPVLRMMKHQNEFLLIAWVANIIMCLTYLIQNFQDPSNQFHHDFFHFVTPVAHNPLMAIMLLLSIADLFIGLVNGIYLFTRKIPLLKKLLSLKYAKIDQQDKIGFLKSEFVYVWSNILKKTFYNFYIVLFLMMVVVHPFFASFILIEIINRIQMGRFIIRSIKETWFQLLVAVGLLLVFNFVFSQILYDFFTSASGYGTICSSQFLCLLLLTDQNFKGGAGAMGNVTSNYVNMVFNMQVLFQILNIIFGLKVISQIFSGTIIDKFSQLRQEEEGIAEDENTICFICGQERFDLDLQYEGFDAHTEKSHKVMNYMYYMFYLRRCPTREYGIIERYVYQCKFKSSEEWIPEDNSVAKQEKQRQEKLMEKEDFKKKHSQYWQIKLKEMKRFHQKLEIILKDMKDITKESNKKPPVQAID